MASTAAEPLPASSSEQPFRVADWTVDPAGGRLLRADETVKLEPKVMDVLVYLARRPGQVVPRAELEAALWPGMVVGYDALTRAMFELRRAFGDDSRDPRFIETVSKKGYRLVATVRPAEAPAAVVGAAGAATAEDRATRRWPGPWAITASVLVVIVAALFVRLFPWQVEEGAVRPQPPSTSIAVLPLVNLNGDSEEQYFADGMTDDLITDLTKVSGLLVISRESSFAYEGTADPRRVAEELGVRYVLHGSVRRAGGRVRLNAQLTDAASGGQLWAERYDGELREVFAVQDQITEQIVSALAVKLTPGERQYLARADTDDLEAYEHFLRGREQFFRYAKASNRAAREQFQVAIERDPGFARAYALLAWTHTFDFMNGWSETPERSLELGEQLAGRALAIDESLPVAYFVRGLVHRERGEYVKALVEAEKAISVDPNYANGHVLYATLLYYAGRPQEGLERMQMAIRLNPHHPYNYPFHLGQAYFVLGRYDEAIEAFERGLTSNPTSERLRVWLAATYAQAGRVDDARWEIDQVLTVNPDFSLRRLSEAFPFSDPADLERFLQGLRRAGLSD
jgi:TolB-like protein/DNA-binding winged helix-turn-helix (wHTH) protein/Tfp pilus assembly protein PilF